MQYSDRIPELLPLFFSFFGNTTEDRLNCFLGISQVSASNCSVLDSFFNCCKLYPVTPCEFENFKFASYLKKCFDDKNKFFLLQVPALDFDYKALIGINFFLLQHLNLLFEVTNHVLNDSQVCCFLSNFLKQSSSFFTNLLLLHLIAALFVSHPEFSVSSKWFFLFINDLFPVLKLQLVEKSNETAINRRIIRCFLLLLYPRYAALCDLDTFLGIEYGDKVDCFAFPAGLCFFCYFDLIRIIVLEDANF